MSEERTAQTVLTSENSGDFYAAKLGLPPATEDAGTDEATPIAATPEPATDEADSDLKDPEEALPEHKRKPIAPRIKELTDKVKAERAEKATLLEKSTAYEREIAELKAKLNPPPPPTPDAEPDPTAFTDQKEYAKAYSAWDKLQETKKAEQTKRVETWKEATAKTREKAPDFDQALAAAANIQVAPHIGDAILDSDIGPELQYFFAKNPDTLTELNGMTPIRAIRELGKIEAKLSAAPAPAPAAEPVVIRRAAPAPAEPISPIKGGKTTPESAIGSDGEFRGSFAQYKAERQAGRIR